ncbi:transposase [Acidianus sp. DSM 29099]|nr:transposase [Acidianus sp. RZ1]
MREIFAWQMEKYQKVLKLVNPAYTSRACPRCGYIADRDLVDSINITGWEPPLVPLELTPLKAKARVNDKAGSFAFQCWVDNNRPCKGALNPCNNELV